MQMKTDTHKKMKVVIVGGGSAGWMSAAILASQLKHLNLELCLIESEQIGTIGVGEGSTPALKSFFDSLNVSEEEWMPKCNATYKCGITFKHWSTKPGFESYYHPFASLLDNQTLPLFIANAQARINGLDVEAHPNRFFLSAHLAKKNLAPKPHFNFPFEVHYGYHFDASLLSAFLKEKAATLGVHHQVATVESIERNDHGDIAALLTQQGERISGDFFVDCSGFRGLLIQQNLGTSFVSYKHNLLNDAAVALGSEMGDELPSQTVSTALTNGWAWKIPLTNRYGNGYVYSGAHCSGDEAETELRRHLGLLDADVSARHLKMKVGRVEKHWNHNCLAVGLSQGFIEPLEATALFLIQQTVALFVDYFTRGEYGDEFRDQFNRRVNRQFDGTRDYIVSHYKTNSRDDSDYWRDSRANPNDISDPLRELYKCWMGGGDLAAEVKKQKMDSYYPVPSWYCLFAGMGIFPPQDRLRPPGVNANPYDMARIDDFISRCALNYDSHAQVLAQQVAR